MNELAMQDALARSLVEGRRPEGAGLSPAEADVLARLPPRTLARIVEGLAGKRIETLAPCFPRALAELERLGALSPAALLRAFSGVGDPADLLDAFPAWVEAMPGEEVARAKAWARYEGAVARLSARSAILPEQMVELPRGVFEDGPLGAPERWRIWRRADGAIARERV